MALTMSRLDFTIYINTHIRWYKYDMNFIISKVERRRCFIFFGNISLLFFFRFPEVVLFYFAFSI